MGGPLKVPGLFDWSKSTFLYSGMERDAGQHTLRCIQHGSNGGRKKWQFFRADGQEWQSDHDF